jgi:hypothetical protein
VDDFRCHSESFAIDKRKAGEGRLFVTPFYAGWTEGRGQGRMSRVTLLEMVVKIEKRGAGIVLTLAVAGTTPEPEPEPEPEGELGGLRLLEISSTREGEGGVEEIVLVGFLPRARDKACVLLSQLADAAKAQVNTGNSNTSSSVGPASAAVLERSSSAIAASGAEGTDEDEDEDEGGGGRGIAGMVSAAPVLQGWLGMVKKGGLGNSGKLKTEQRWCQLRGPLMMYSEKVGGKKIGFFHLGGAKIMCTTAQKKDRTFSVKLPARTYVLQADSTGERRESTLV